MTDARRGRPKWLPKWSFGPSAIGRCGLGVDYRVTAGSVSEQGSAEPSKLPLQSPQQATPSGQRPSQAAQLAAPRQLGSSLGSSLLAARGPPARFGRHGWLWCRFLEILLEI